MIEEQRRLICEKYATDCLPPEPNTKIGVSLNIRDGQQPINGLRHRPEGGTCGWYVWAGQSFSEADDFFQPLHVEHLPDWCAQILPYLGLPPGWRFLIADSYEDIWFDPNLISDT